MRNTAQESRIWTTALHAMPRVAFGKDRDTFNANGTDSAASVPELVLARCSPACACPMCVAPAVRQRKKTYDIPQGHLACMTRLS